MITKLGNDELQNFLSFIRGLRSSARNIMKVDRAITAINATPNLKDMYDKRKIKEKNTLTNIK